jgi:hypothetical protein
MVKITHGFQSSHASKKLSIETMPHKYTIQGSWYNKCHLFLSFFLAPNLSSACLFPLEEAQAEQVAPRRTSGMQGARPPTALSFASLVVSELVPVARS